MSLAVFGQSAGESEHGRAGNNNTYAVTDIERNGFKWSSLRTLNLSTGVYSNILVTLLNNNETQPPAGTPPVIAFNGVAAMALDEDNSKLFYIPMLTDQLFYIDLRTMTRHLVTSHFTGLMPKASDQSNIITRMVIGDDGKGYALTNDGHHFLRFNTNNNATVTDLGSLVDDPANNEMSVHNLCSSFGGDLLADDEGHLYLFTSRNHVFKINIQSRIARFLGTVSNLPSNFTTSGAVVNKPEKKIVIVSALDSSDIYTVNLETLVARPFNAHSPYHPADLANGSVLKTKDHDHHDNWVMLSGNPGDSRVRLFPNPVTDKQFKIQFTDINAGTYTIEINDTKGKSVMLKSVTIGGKDNLVTVALPGIISGGIYLIRISTDNKALYSGKIVVE